MGKRLPDPVYIHGRESSPDQIHVYGRKFARYNYIWATLRQIKYMGESLTANYIWVHIRQIMPKYIIGESSPDKIYGLVFASENIYGRDILLLNIVIHLYG
jgi:predicted metal-dependent phosphoesterase TrpH